MDYLELTLASAAENLALDEALLEAAEEGTGPGEVLRLWEPTAPLVVVGRSSRFEDEVRLDVCRRLGIPVLRRVSGGAAIVTGPGCLMYAVVLSYRARPQLRLLEHAHRLVMDTLAEALRPLVPEIQVRGICDLSVAGCKVSGNSVRCKRDHLLYHGTLLYSFPLELIERCLKMPSRQPDYRQGRAHAAFVANLDVPPERLRQRLRQAWGAEQELVAWPAEATAQLVAERYRQADWVAE